MPDRRRQIELLLASRFDLLWFPTGALRTSGGLAPGAKRPCPDCAHGVEPGWIHDRFGRRSPCTTCGGSQEPSGSGGQWLVRDRGAGYVWVDRMDALETPIGDQETRASARPRRTVRCDSCDGAGVVKGERCRWCDGQGRRDLHAFELRLETETDPEPDPLSQSIIRRDQAGSYHELDLALSRITHTVNKPLPFFVLTVNAAQVRRLLDDVYLNGRAESSLSSFEQALIQLALDYLDTQMPDPIRVPADLVANQRIREEHRTRARGRHIGTKALQQRDREITQLARRGKPAQWIAAEYGLHVSSVYAIVKTADRREPAA